MHKLKLTGLSILSGLLMGIAWPETGGIAPLFFIAFIPLLYVEYIITQNPKQFYSRHVFYNAYLTFLTFTTFTTWWIWHASGVGMIIAEILTSLYLSIIFFWFHLIKKRLGNKKGYFSLIVLWIGFEWLHYNWELSHPWNTLGNVFANYTKIIQWYEYTGVLGGSLWILVINIFLFHLLKKLVFDRASLKSQRKVVTSILFILIIPALFSVTTYNYYAEKGTVAEVIVIQPNIDPYKDKFEGMSDAEQIDKIIALAKQKITSETKYIVAPETAIPRGSIESEMEQNYGIQAIRKLIQAYPNIHFVIGAATYINYPKSKQKPTLTARPDQQSGGWYDAFNTAIKIDSSDKIQTYHKSKLVLGVEKLPYPKVFGLLEKIALDLGGTVGSLGTEKEAFNFVSDTTKVAPVICYESIYGEYFSSYVNKGANLVFIITNDGWWQDTPGYKQHLAYARLRAIETRRSIARSANTGISCFINQRGDIINPTTWWKEQVISNSVHLNDIKTTYTIYGDLIGRIAAFLAVLLLLWSWSVKIRQPL